MNQAVSIEFPQADVRRIMGEMARARREFGMTLKASISWAGSLVCRSLGASARVAREKLRPIVANPDARYKTDARRAPFGVMRFDKHGDGGTYFQPIYKTGEFGKLRFFDAKTASWFVRDAANPKGRWERLPSGPDAANPGASVPGIETDKRRIIGRRGLARSSWTKAAARTRKGGTILSHGVPRLAELEWTGGESDPGLLVTNYVRYMHKALEGGPQAVETAVERATSKMAWNIQNRLAKKMGVKK